jgi:hypothetical protein
VLAEFVTGVYTGSMDIIVLPTAGLRLGDPADFFVL